MNGCFTQGKFPNELKCSRIVPIYKDGNRLFASNYRPISILPVLSKNFETILCDRFISFLAQNQFINANQNGFQEHSSTFSAATALVDLLQNKIDTSQNIKASCVFIDLRKAFDTVPDDNLLNKLDRYGIRGNANALIRDYLFNRKQNVDIDDKMSDTITNTNQFLLPLGSNLGPLLFLIKWNPQNLFADDAVPIYFETDIDILNAKIQEDLDSIANWLTVNKLTIKAEKTK